MNSSGPIPSLEKIPAGDPKVVQSKHSVGAGETPTASPCIQVCRMEGDFCCGCRRTLGEIAEWGRMSEAERSRVLQRIERRQAVFTRSAAT